MFQFNKIKQILKFEKKQTLNKFVVQHGIVYFK